MEPLPLSPFSTCDLFAKKKITIYPQYYSYIIINN